MTRILLFCDHKWRDLPNLCALKIELQNRYGYDVLLTSPRDRSSLVELYQPDAVVFNHMNGPFYRSLSEKLHQQNISVIVLPTEGKPGSKQSIPLICGKYTDYSNVDLYLSWSENVKQNMIQLNTLPPEKIAVVGCTRFDFYYQPLRSLVESKVQFCQKYDLDPNNPIVTWATQYNYARFVNNNREFHRKDIKDLGLNTYYKEIGFDIESLPERQSKQRQAAADAFFSMVEHFPQVQFVIKPHPGEDADFYRTEISKRGKENVSFIFQEYIWDILNATDIHLHRNCTTAVEAWLLEKPTVEMNMYEPHQFQLSQNEMQSGSEIATSVGDLCTIIKNYLSGGKITEDMKLSRKQYISNSFYLVDGKRIQAAAEVIHNLLLSKGDRYHRKRYFLAKYFLIDKLNLSYSFAFLKPSTWRIERPNNSDEIDFMGQMDKQITRYDVRTYEGKIRNHI